MKAENRPPELIEEVIRFCKEVGLPTTLADLGIEKVNEEEILKVAEASSIEDETIHNMSFEVDVKMVKNSPKPQTARGLFLRANEAGPSKPARPVPIGTLGHPYPSDAE